MGNKANSVGATLGNLDEKAQDGDVSVGHVVDALERRGHGPLLFVPALLGVSPAAAVPGVPSILALAILLVAGQVVLGREGVWPADALSFDLSQQQGFFGPRSWGSLTLGEPMATSGDLAFVGASTNDWTRALDAARGEEPWSDVVAPAVSTQAILTHEGADHVIFAVGGNSTLQERVADRIVAYRLGD